MEARARKGVDDGVLLVIAKDNPRDLRRMRLEVGRGAEGVIPDARSKQILQDIIAPRFRENDFYGGLNAGVVAIHALLDKEPFPEPTKGKAAQGTELPMWVVVLIVLLPLIVIASIVVAAVRARQNLGSSGWGRSSGIILGGSILDSLSRSSRSSDSWSSSDSGGFSGGGGDFGGGGASGDW